MKIWVKEKDALSNRATQENRRYANCPLPPPTPRSFSNKDTHRDTHTTVTTNTLPDLPTPALPNIASLTSALLAMLGAGRQFTVVQTKELGRSSCFQPWDSPYHGKSAILKQKRFGNSLEKVTGERTSYLLSIFYVPESLTWSASSLLIATTILQEGSSNLL